MTRLSGPLSPPPRIAWRGQRGEPQHAWVATERGRIKVGTPALCGSGWFEDRWLLPGGAKCGACGTKVDELTRQALRGPAGIELGL